MSKSHLPRILLLSAYDTASHRHWHQGLCENLPQYQWQVLTLPGRHFAWRLRGNSLSWAALQREILEQPFDLLIATSMVDISALKGFVANLANTPTLVYFHENQFAYPSNHRQQGLLEQQMLNLYSAYAADFVLFNSEFNRSSFCSGAKALLAKMPDYAPSQIVDEIQQRSAVLAVPIAVSALQQSTANMAHNENLAAVSRWDSSVIKIVWVARWEYDKGPDQLLAVLRELELRKVAFQICLLGQEFRNAPQVFETIKTEFSQQIVHSGFEASTESYQAWLRSADIVLSTAVHEFQGLAVLEAIAAGCLPVVPRRQVYPELIPAQFTYAVYPHDIGREAHGAVDVITSISEAKPALPSVVQYGWSHLVGEYQAIIDRLIAARPVKNS